MNFCGQKYLFYVCFAQVIHCFVAADFAMSSGQGGNRSNTGNSSQILTKI
jgi:hypothetical protein